MEFHIPSLKDILTNGLKPEASARPRKNRETSKPNIDPFALRYFGIIYSIQGASEPGEKIRSLGRGSSGTNAGRGSAPMLGRGAEKEECRRARKGNLYTLPPCPECFLLKREKMARSGPAHK
jgi:hypothetical protein